jgi:hypothetical protein
LVSLVSLSGLGRLGLLSVFVFMRWESIHDLCLNSLGWTFWIVFLSCFKQRSYGSRWHSWQSFKLWYVDIPAVCSYSCSILLLSLLRIDGEVSPRALGVITRIQEVVGENYVLCYYVGSQEVCLLMSLVTLPSCDSLCSTGNHVPSHCQLQNMAPQYASSLQMNSVQYWHLPPALPSPANATQPMKPSPITVACNSWKVRTHLGQYRIWLVRCSFN